MKKLYLTSLGIDAMSNILPKPPTQMKVAFIPTAADPYTDKWFMEADIKKLNDMRFQLTLVDLKDKDEDQLRKSLQPMDMVYVCGGNSFYLLEKIYESGFDKVIKEFIEKGVIYAGASAGAVVAGPTIEPLASLDDPNKAPRLKTMKGLGFVDFVILPHFGKEKYLAKYNHIIELYSNRNFELKTLTDHQAIIVEGDQFRIIDTN